jgi:glycosyltransferase involved in cell wall biosynthesis
VASRERAHVALVLDWFFYYAAAIANELSARCEVLMITRDHGIELGTTLPAADAKRSALRPEVQLQLVTGTQSDPVSLVSAMEARGRLAAFRPDVVHFQHHTDWRLEVAGSLRGVPRLLTIHDVTPHPGAERRSHAVHRGVERHVRRHADGFVVHGESLRQRLMDVEDVGDRPVFVIPLGVLSHPASVAALPREPRLLFFGRMELYKGLDVLIEATRQVRRVQPDVRVVLAGRGPETARLMSETAGDDTFEWLDRFITDDELAGLFASSLFVVLPYREASQSGVVPLAFANGRTVVATRVGALVEAVEDGRTGLLCEPDAVDDLASAILTLLEDRHRLEALSRNAHEEVLGGKMSARHIADLHMNAYQTLMGNSF